MYFYFSKSSVMKIALIGASGLVGTAVLNEALNRGHEVTAIVRQPEKIKTQNDKLIIVKADATTIDQTVPLLQHHDVVVSTYNAGWTNPNLFNDFLQGSRSIQQAVKQAGVKRYLVVLGAGSLYIQPGVQLVDTPQFPEAYKPGATAARDYLNELKDETELDWTALSPAIEFNPGTPHERRGTYRTNTNNPVFDAQGKSTISSEDLAVAILDELENPKFIKQRFTVAY